MCRYNLLILCAQFKIFNERTAFHMNLHKKTLFQKIVIIITLSMGIFSASISKEIEQEKGKSYLMGVFPYLAPRELEKMYSPIAANFSSTINKNILFRTSSTYKKFMSNLDKQIYDIVFVQPFDYVEIADKYGYRPLVTRNKPLPAILVVKPDSQYKNVEDLRGKTISLPPPVAAMSYLIKDYLKKNGLDPATDVTIVHHRSHASCMRSVLLGKAQACGTAGPAVRFFQEKMKVKLKVIAKTKGIPSTLFAVHPRVSEQERKNLLQKISTWPNTDDGKKLLKGTKVEKFVPIENKAYDGVRVMSKKFRKHK